MLFMLFGAFVVVVWRPCCPGDHIDCIIILRPPIHGTLHIILAASSGTAAAIAPTSVNHCCDRGGVFVIFFVVDDEDYTDSIIVAPSGASLSFALSSMTTNNMNSFNLHLQRRLFRSLCRWWRRTIHIHSCWQPAWSSFCRIAAVRQSTPIAIDSLTLIVAGSALVIHREFALFLSDVPTYALLWVW